MFTLVVSSFRPKAAHSRWDHVKAMRHCVERIKTKVFFKFLMTNPEIRPIRLEVLRHQVMLI